MNMSGFAALLCGGALLLSGCSAGSAALPEDVQTAPYTRTTQIEDVMHDPVFGNYGRHCQLAGYAGSTGGNAVVCH